MAVRKIRGKWWVDLRHDYVRYRKKSPLNTREGALLFETTLRRRLASGEPLVAPECSAPTTLSEFVREWLETYVKANNKPSEQRAKRMILDRHLLPALGHVPLSEIDSGAVERYKATALARGLHPKTVNNHLAVLRRALNVAVEWGRLPRAPVVRRLQLPPREVVALAPDDVARLLAASDGRTHALVLLAVRTGMRIGEIRALRWSCVSFDARMITVDRSVVRGITSSPKSNRARRVPISPDLREVLHAMRRPEGLVFPGQSADGTLSEARLTRILATTCARAGVRRVGWHILRHTFASELAARGASASAIQRLLGHSTLAMTERYVHVDEPALRDAIALLSPSDPPIVGTPWATPPVLASASIMPLA